MRDFTDNICNSAMVDSLNLIGDLEDNLNYSESNNKKICGTSAVGTMPPNSEAKQTGDTWSNKDVKGYNGILNPE